VIRAEEDKPTSGLWRITARGHQFVAGHVTIPKYAHILYGKLEQFSGPSLTWSDVRERAEGWKWSHLCLAPAYIVGKVKVEQLNLL